MSILPTKSTSRLVKVLSHTHICHRGRTALHYAALRGNVDLVRMLLDAGASVVVVDHFGKSAKV